ncbi:colanic acid biosynthesis glycosyltransferase WcaL [Sinorhizobium meliloti]|uniref:glycosyltransferase n=2 Tax=Rhizobium meliloti TaxID=382 RepID=UPI0002A5B7EF|nr:glycosyltransferase [Sinorhizobium meliloti]AGA11128.1 Glycosyltransferase [Sinorhizobium meliloti GR4]RVL01825.1 colanic acid biosynthesis glycosyltransferase WcaL [Sinorhizobium meliloti]RVM93222.1 colanic acid biosynthesis glycosyltransferase WcaL [Sinorhizobium meliloti]RVN12659.1 colanic acid biosynthesis glycosyltransferase WcaL [Sinorhizobium meliloti]
MSDYGCGMKYLFINGRFPQYSQTFVHDQIKAVKYNGDAEVAVFARSLAPFRFEQSAPECAGGLLYAKPYDLKMLSRIVRGVLKHPIRAAYLAQLRLRKKIHLQTVWLGVQLGWEPDVAVTHFGNNLAVGVQLKKYVFPTMKNVVVFHGHDVSSYVQKNGWKTYQDAARYIDCAVCVNRIWADELRCNTEINDVRTIYLGTKIDNVPRRRNGDGDTFSILFVGRFVEKKGFDVLYSAVKSAAAGSGRPIRVHCVGDGPQFKSCKARAKKDGLAENFIFYGSKQKSFVRQLMAECDLLVAPSRTAQDGDSEGLPVVLMEAMVAGIPIVSTFHSGIPELIAHGEGGVLVPQGDTGKLREAIEYAIRNPDMMEHMARAARAHVVVAHDEKIQTRVFVEALREC